MSDVRPKKVVDVVVYKHGERIVVGEAEVDEVQLSIVTGTIHINDPKALGIDFDLGSYSVGSHTLGLNGKVEMEVEFKSYVRKPFSVDAVEVTEENMELLATELELGRIQPAIGQDKAYIIVEKDKVPNVFRIYAGFFITKMGKNIRAYSAKTFEEQFTEATDDVQRWARLITNRHLLKENA